VPEVKRVVVLLGLSSEGFGAVADSVELTARDADIEQLEVWSRRVLTAVPLDEVLA